MSVFAQTTGSPDPLGTLLSREGPALVPLLLGALAVYLLLPRPRPYPRSYGLICALAALGTAGVFLLRPMGFSPEVGLFYAFSALALIGGVLLITQDNAARAALSFVLVVLSTSGLFLLLAAPFLFAATIIVYAGAIIVTFLFVLMLAQQTGASDADSRSREPALATLTGVLLLGVVLYVVRLAHPGPEFNDLLRAIAAAREADSAADLHAILQKQNPDKPGETMTLFSQAAERLNKAGMAQASAQATEIDIDWLSLAPPEAPADQLDKVKVLPLLDKLETLLETRYRAGLSPSAAGRHASTLSGAPGGTPWGEIRRDPKTRVAHLPAENTAYVGRSLFTDFLLPVEITGLLLLVATVAAILLAQRPSESEPSSTGATFSQTVTQRRPS
jgi:NADH:ubiquinone oxidoreductase subunit 6 (subunit J)